MVKNLSNKALQTHKIKIFKKVITFAFNVILISIGP